jgi:hypothetical protein
MAGAQIVEHDWIVAGCRKSLAGVTADVSGSAGDEDLQSHEQPKLQV